MQRAIIELRYGPEGGTKMVLSAGDALRVGRKPQSQWLIDDKQMSGVHFEIAYDGSRCEVRDLKSATGTLVGGQKIDSPAEIQNGGWIRAGETDFMVYFEAATPPPDDEMDVLLEAEDGELAPLEKLWVDQNRAKILSGRSKVAAGREAARERLHRVEGRLFVVLDAARSDRILTLVRESVETYRSLYEGIDGEALEHVAPYLVELGRGSELLDRIVREGFGDRWGIFIEYPRSFKELRQHLRRFLMVVDADTRKKMYFRFYDPVVLREFLPTCTPKQRAEIFGEISSFLFEDEHGRVEKALAEVS